MKYRQSVISVFKPLDGEGNFLTIPDLEIIFRQPFHDLGLAYSFNFTKTYFAPFAECNISIEGIDSKIAESFYFERKDLRKRPLVEIRAGYSALRMKKLTELEALKASLPLIYSGSPYYTQDTKIVGGRVFNIQLSDFQSSVRVGRVAVNYAKGRPVIDIIDSLMKSTKTLYDLHDLRVDDNFTVLKLENDLFFNGQQILTSIIPALARAYPFYFFVEGNGVITFKPGSQTVEAGELKDEISKDNGLIEHPTSINFAQWSIRTFFGLPKVFYPRDKVRIISDHFARIKAPLLTNNTVDDTLDGLIVDAKYNWNDSEADIDYTVSPEGQPINIHTIINI